MHKADCLLIVLNILKEERKREMQKRRRPRGYGNPRRKGVKPNFAPVIVILCLAVGCGYATAKYVVDPVVNYVPQLTNEKSQEAETENSGSLKTEVSSEETAEVVEGEADVQEEKVRGYAVQYGCYSSQAAAESAMSSLGISGLQVMEQNNMYKITGQVFETKDEAREALKSAGAEGAFVTTVYE